MKAAFNRMIWALCLLLPAIGYAEPLTKNQLTFQVSDLLDAGDYVASRNLLNNHLELYRNNSLLLTYSGRSYYELGELESAENDLMAALVLDSGNQEAKQFIEQIRDLREKTESEDAREARSILYDKAGDLILVILGFLFAISIKEWVSQIYKTKKSDWLIKQQRWLDVGVSISNEIDARNYVEVARLIKDIETQHGVGFACQILPCADHQQIASRIVAIEEQWAQFKAK